MHNNYTSPESRWQAVQTRDPSAATAFVYAVTSTHIYCRPSCPSRLARRANVTFYDTSAAARAASFRPCKRCKPDQDFEPHPTFDLAAKACARIDELQGEVTIDDLAGDMKVSSRHLRSVFNNVKHCTPTAYAAMVREKRQHDLARTNPADFIEYNTLDMMFFDIHEPHQQVISNDSTPISCSSDLTNIDFYYSPSSYEQIDQLAISINGDLYE